MKKLIVAPCVALLGWVTAVANAADLGVKAPPFVAPGCAVNDIVRANQQVGVAFIDKQVSYGPEILNPGTASADPTGVPLDSEKGWLPGVRATGSYMGAIPYIPVCNLYLSASYSWVKGHTDYSATVGPVLSNTDGAKVQDWDFRAGKGFDLGSSAMITPYFGAGTRWWDRLLTGASGFDEVYQHAYAGGGLLLQYSPFPRWVLSANGLVGSTFDANMESTLTPGGSPTACAGCKFALGSSLIYNAGISVDYAITDHVHANAGLDYSFFKYGQSPEAFSAAGNAAFEPNSKTSDLTLSVGLGYHW